MVASCIYWEAAMQMPWAILLLHLNDQQGAPFPASFAERMFTSAGAGTGNMVDYYREVSHGRADLSGSKVYGWFDLDHSMDELQKYTAREQETYDGWTQAQRDADPNYVNNKRRDKIVAWGEEAATANDIVLSGFTGTLLVYSDNVDYFGRDRRSVVNYNRADPTMFSVDLTGTSHEMGHGFGFAHSRREGAGDEYGDLWDIMSAYTVRDATGVPFPSGVDPAYQRVGPGMNAANMDLMGWLDETLVWEGNGPVTLRPLHRMDLPGYLAAKVGPTYVEFRMNERWDAAIGKPCVLLHHVAAHPSSGRLCSYQRLGKGPGGMAVRALDAGDGWQQGSESDVFSDFMRITVTRIDANDREAHLDVVVRPAQRPPVEGPLTLLGGVEVDGGGWIWIPGKGLVKVPPRSPLLHVLRDLAELSSVDTLQLALTERNRLSDRVLAGMHARLGRMMQARSEYHVPASPELRGRGGEHR